MERLLATGPQVRYHLYGDLPSLEHVEGTMAQVTVRDLDDWVVDRLKERAKVHERSLEAELRTILRDGSAGSDQDASQRIPGGVTPASCGAGRTVFTRQRRISP